jgi:hypothetical protein
MDTEEILAYDSYETMYFKIIKTKKMKGHSKRCMVIAQMHVPSVSPAEKEFAMGFLFRYIISEHCDHDWTIMEPTHATIPNHWHLVASTLGESMATDIYQIVDTDRIEIRFMKAAGRSRNSMDHTGFCCYSSKLGLHCEHIKQ